MKRYIVLTILAILLGSIFVGDAARVQVSDVPIALTDGDMFVGNASNIGTGVTMSGDVTMSNAGVTAIGAGAIDYENTVEGINWTSRTSAADNAWSSVAYGDGLFVAVAFTGTGNRVMTSPDGVNWTSRTSAADNDWISVTYGNGLFVAVAKTGTDNRVMTSPDGITWTIRTSAADNEWSGVAYGNGVFVAVATSGTGNRVMTSPDGVTWTIRTSAADNSWYSITYGNGLFVTTAYSGTDNRVMTSPDGVTWTIRTSAADNPWGSVTYGNGLFVAISALGSSNRVMTSPDGITWTIRTSAADNSWLGVTYGDGLFVAVAYSGSGNRVMTSPDGVTWTIRTSAADNEWEDITYGNGIFVAVAGFGTSDRVMTSGAEDSNVIQKNNIYHGPVTIHGDLTAAGDLTVSGDDLKMATNTDAFVMVADGTEYSPVEMTGDVSITNAGVTAVGDDSHAHTGTTISGLDISADTNLAVTAPIVLTDDTISVTVLKDIVAGSGLTGGADDVLPGADADVTLNVQLLKDLVTTAPLTGGTDDILVGADADVTIALTVLKDIVAAGTGMSGGEDDVLPGADADVTITLTTAKDIVAGTGLSGGEDDVLPGADADTTINIDTTWAATFASINTGEGVTEVYAMNQDVETDDDVTFNDVTVSDDLRGTTLNDQFSYMLAGNVLQNATTPPLVLAWISPATTELDLSGNSNDATYSNFVTGDQGYKGLVWGLSFYTDNDEYLTVGDDAAFSWDDSGANPFSFCAWVEVVATVSVQTIMAKYDVQATDREWLITLTAAEKPQIEFYDESTDVSCTNVTDAALSAGWHFLVHTYDSTGGSSALSDTNSIWYVDGLTVAESQSNDGSYAAMEAGATDVTIGGYNTGAAIANFFQGDMGIIWLEDVELSAAQVWSAYISTRGYLNE